MEDVLDVYERPSDAAHPVVCLDETSRQLLGDLRAPQLAAPGVPARRDPEYVRGGIAQLFLVTEPLRGWRQIAVGARRTRLDFAHCVQKLVDVHYPEAERIVLVMDQLNIHSPASRSAAFPPEEAKRLAKKLEIHHTPKHGSWLNMAELELKRARAPVPRPTAAGPDDDGDRGHGLGGSPERGYSHDRLAVHDRRRPHQAPTALSGV